jgi:flagellar M-ring protein FliF
VKENITYQTSRTVKKTRIPSGGIRRMSLALLLDQEVNWERDAAGYRRVLIPPGPEKLKIIRDLVAGATGFSTERGDQIVIETLPFESTLALEPPPAAAPQAAPRLGNPFTRFEWNRKMTIIAGSAAGALLLCVVAWRVARRRLKSRRATASSAPELGAGEAAAKTAALPGSTVEDQIESKLAERAALQQKLDAQALNSLKMAPVITKAAEVLAKHLREKITKEPDLSAQILRTWIREEDN